MSKEAAEFRESLGLTYQKLVTIYLETGETSGISVDDLMQAYADKVKKDLIGFVSYGEMMLMAEKRGQDVRHYDYYEGQKDLLKWLKEQLKTK